MSYVVELYRTFVRKFMRVISCSSVGYPCRYDTYSVRFLLPIKHLLYYVSSFVCCRQSKTMLYVNCIVYRLVIIFGLLILFLFSRVVKLSEIVCASTCLVNLVTVVSRWPAFPSWRHHCFLAGFVLMSMTVAGWSHSGGIIVVIVSLLL